MQMNLSGKCTPVLILYSLHYSLFYWMQCSASKSLELLVRLPPIGLLEHIEGGCSRGRRLLLLCAHAAGGWRRAGT